MMIQDTVSETNKFRFVYLIKPRDFSNAGDASANVKAELQKHGIEPDVIRRVSIICFEAEMNIVLYTKGGKLIVEVDDQKVDILALDKGPGIEDIELVMTPGYSTAPEWALEYGFGAGMGLPNIKNNSDVFEIESEVGKGTVVHSIVYRRKNEVKGNN